MHISLVWRLLVWLLRNMPQEVLCLGRGVLSEAMLALLTAMVCVLIVTTIGVAVAVGATRSRRRH